MKRMMVYAGIDGGGTGTILELQDQAGERLGREHFGPFNLNSIGEERFRQLLRELFGRIHEAGECAGICIGAAGISNPAVGKIIREEAGRFGLSGRLKLRGDHEIALYGATGGGPGSILIAGTGSICTGINGQGKSARAGGWGHLMDDAGSGYALGRDALSAVARAWDGRGEKTLLTELIFRELAVSDMGGLIAAVYGAADKSLIASLAPLVEQAGRQGDEAALLTIRRNGEALAELVLAVYRSLELDRMRLTLMGGLLVHPTLLRDAAAEAIQALLPEAAIAAAKTDAAGGAALLAAMQEEHCDSQ